MKSLYRNCLRGLFVVLLAGPVAAASPWVETGDELTRHHLQVLADTGAINTNLTTWPIGWASVRREIEDVDPAQLNAAELASYNHLKVALRRAGRWETTGAELAGNTSTVGLRDFSAASREKAEAAAWFGWSAGKWYGKVKGAAVADDIDDQRFRADGSYLVRTIGNWGVGIGAVDRWWGPGWQSSLILSNNARPAPGVFATRVDDRASDWPVLEWLGPWNLQVFLSQLEGDRFVPDAKLFGTRLNVRPFQALEVGISRTAQWGGDGRPEDLDTFWNMMIGRDNRGSQGINTDASNEPGNQLAGIDWRLGYGLGGASGAFYGQLIGEDEAGGLPSRFIGLVGLETAYLWGATHSRLALEASNTTAQFNKADDRPNYAYEHGIYRSGYRYRGRTLGASTDNDSELLVVKGLHQFQHGDSFNWSLGRAHINADGNPPRAVGGHTLTDVGERLWYASAEYQVYLSAGSRLGVGANYYSEALELAGQAVESGVYLRYQIELGR